MPAEGTLKSPSTKVSGTPLSIQHQNPAVAVHQQQSQLSLDFNFKKKCLRSSYLQSSAFESLWGLMDDPSHISLSSLTFWLMKNQKWDCHNSEALLKGIPSCRPDSERMRPWMRAALLFINLAFSNNSQRIRSPRVYQSDIKSGSWRPENRIAFSSSHVPEFNCPGFLLYFLLLITVGMSLCTFSALTPGQRYPL